MSEFRYGISSRERQPQQSNDSQAELLAAASVGNIGIVQTLFEIGADLNARDLFGNTALIYAAAGGHLDLVRWLVMQGVQVNAKNQIGMTALQRAKMKGRSEIVGLLKKYGAEDETQRASCDAGATGGPASLLQAARAGNLKDVRACLASGADVNQLSGEGWTALMIATLKGYKEIVQTLLEQERAQVNARSHHGWTALRFAVSMGDSETIGLLLAAGAEVNAPDHDGWTPLMQAAGEGNLECVEILLAAGADVYAKNRLCETASDIAAQKSFTEIVGLLAGAEHNSKDSDIVEPQART
jgi:ankyrin repeat protein